MIEALLLSVRDRGIDLVKNRLHDCFTSVLHDEPSGETYLQFGSVLQKLRIMLVFDTNSAIATFGAYKYPNPPTAQLNSSA